MALQQVKGQWGENIALQHLTAKGYRFIEANYTTSFGEIDLIFLDHDVLVFVEVKTRKSDAQLPLLETVNKNKINKILKSAEKYIDSSKLQFSEMRVDVVLISVDQGKHDITHIENYC